MPGPLSQSIQQTNQQLLNLINLRRQQALDEMRERSFELDRNLRLAQLGELERKRKQRESLAGQFDDPLLRESILSGLSPTEAARLSVLSPDFGARTGGLPEGTLGPEPRDVFERRRMFYQLAGLTDPEEERRQAILTEQAKTPILTERKTAELAAERASELAEKQEERDFRAKLADDLKITRRDKLLFVGTGKLPADKETNLPSSIESYLARQVNAGDMTLDKAIENLSKMKAKEGGLTEEDLLRVSIDLTKAEAKLSESDVLRQALSILTGQGASAEPAQRDFRQLLQRNIEMVQETAERLSGGGRRPTTPRQPREPSLPTSPQTLGSPFGTGTSEALTKWPFGQLEPIVAPETPASRQPRREGTMGEGARTRTGESQLSQQEIESKAQTTIAALKNQGLSEAEIRRLIGQSDRTPEQKRALLKALGQSAAGTFVTP